MSQATLEKINIRKHALSELDFLSFCDDVIHYESEPQASETTVNIEDCSTPVLFHEMLAIFQIEGQLYMTAMYEYSNLNTGTLQATRKLAAVNVNKLFGITTKFAKIIPAKTVVGLIAKEDESTSSPIFYLFLKDVEFKELLNDSEKALNQFPKLHRIDSYLVTIDCGKYFNGEQISKLHYMREGVILQTVANSFFILEQGATREALYLPSPTSSPSPFPPVVSTTSAEEAKAIAVAAAAEDNGYIFKKLNIPSNVQLLCTHKDMIAFVVDGKLYKWTPTKGLELLNLNERCRDMTFIMKKLVCLTVAGNCLIFNTDNNNLEATFNAQEFDDMFTEMHYVANGRAIKEFNPENLLFFSETTQRLYVIQDEEPAKVKRITLKEFLQAKDFKLPDRSAFEEDEDEDDEQDELAIDYEAAFENSEAMTPNSKAEKQRQNRVIDFYDRKLREGWKIKSILSGMNCFLFVFYRERGTGHFIKRSLTTYQQTLTDIKICH